MVIESGWFTQKGSKQLELLKKSLSLREFDSNKLEKCLEVFKEKRKIEFLLQTKRTECNKIRKCLSFKKEKTKNRMEQIKILKSLKSEIKKIKDQLCNYETHFICLLESIPNVVDSSFSLFLNKTDICSNKIEIIKVKTILEYLRIYLKDKYNVREQQTVGQNEIIELDRIPMFTVEGELTIMIGCTSKNQEIIFSGIIKYLYYLLSNINENTVGLKVVEAKDLLMNSCKEVLITIENIEIHIADLGDYESRNRGLKLGRKKNINLFQPYLQNIRVTVSHTISTETLTVNKMDKFKCVKNEIDQAALRTEIISKEDCVLLELFLQKYLYSKKTNFLSYDVYIVRIKLKELKESKKFDVLFDISTLSSVQFPLVKLLLA